MFSADSDFWRWTARGINPTPVTSAVILSFAAGGDVSRITAITLLAGVDPLLKDPGKDGQLVNLGSWSLNLNMNVGVP